MTCLLLCEGKNYAFHVKLDEYDYEWARRQGNWFITHGATDKPGYAVRSVGGRLVFLHKSVLTRSFRFPPTVQHIIGDHRNSDRFDNRRANLRWATHQMNARNRFGFVDQQLELTI